MVKPASLVLRAKIHDFCQRGTAFVRRIEERVRDVNGSGNANVPPSPCSPVTHCSVHQPGFAYTSPNPQSLQDKTVETSRRKIPAITSCHLICEEAQQKQGK